MRFSTPVEYQTISQALVKGACPFCTYLKNFQSKIVRELNDPDQITSICNFHTWALAAASNRAVVACIFRKLMKQTSVQASSDCSLCKMISAEEEIRMKEFSAELSQTHVLDWVNAHGSLCIPHGTRFLGYVPPSLQGIILNIVKRNAAQLEEALETLGTRHEKPNEPGGGMLGHAAEFLVSQRGL
jgi:hypothetical protein